LPSSSIVGGFSTTTICGRCCGRLPAAVHGTGGVQLARMQRGGGRQQCAQRRTAHGARRL
jgi:hypothetical protein